MNEIQRAFLDELAALFDKYSIDDMCCADEKTPINFMSNGQTLQTRYYTRGEFCYVKTYVGNYEPRREETINGND